MSHALIFVSAAVALIAIAWLLSGCRRSPPASGAADISAFTLAANDGSPYPLAQHRGQVLLIVNTASGCHYTSQYAGLEKLWERYRARGLVVIAVPSNDFLWQERGDDAQIRSFCSTRFAVSFPLMAKARVKGDEAIPLYRWLTRESPRPGKIGWNFTKFLIGRDGKVHERFATSIEPEAPEVIAAIEKALAEAPATP
jgi:glutathione peroxidase